MNLTPLVSVCIPCYKHVQLLERCLTSIVTQTYLNIEIIITDDSPTDEIQNLIEKHFSDKRIRYVRNIIQLGSPQNWNEGIQLAKGEYIKIMHHDDWFTRDDALELFVSAALSQNADFICSNCIDNFPNYTKKHIIYKSFQKSWMKHNSLILFANFIGAPSVTFFKKPLTGNLTLFDPKTIWFVDILFYFNYVKSNNRIVFINDFLINITAGATTQITNSMISPKIALCEYIYVTKRLDLERDKMSKILYTITLLEKMSKYNIRKKSELEDLINDKVSPNLPFYLLKIPIPYQFYSILKYIFIAF